jgi:hypothetical protein
MSKFYTFSQNNSGGYFVVDDKAGVAEYLIVEANNAKDANEIFSEIGEKVSGFWDFCECCGCRWDSAWEDYDEGTPEPMIYGVPIAEVEQGMFRHRAFVHYLDGTIKEYVFK